jgi:hypothetical protein
MPARKKEGQGGHSVTKETPPLCAGQILTGPLFNEPMRVETVQPNGEAS